MNYETIEILRALKPFVACFFFASIGLFAAAFLWYGAIRRLFFTENEIALGRRMTPSEKKFMRDFEKAQKKQRQRNFPPSEDETEKAMSALAGAMADLRKSEEWRKFVDCAKDIKFTDA